MKIIKNILAIVLGLIIGSAVNMGLVMLGPLVIAPPEGIDMTNMESLAEAMPLFETKHFLFPFLAHALGTFVGAFIAALVAGSRKKLIAMIIGAFFMIGGIANIYMLPSPMWFSIVDLVLAYLPMAYFGAKLAKA